MFYATQIEYCVTIFDCQLLSASFSCELTSSSANIECYQDSKWNSPNSFAIKRMAVSWKIN